MPIIGPPGAVRPALLFIAPDIHGSGKAAQLGESQFWVTRAENARDVYLMRNGFHFSVAVLSETVGPYAIRAAAQVVRAQWPKAWILILGKAPIELDDHLYDETVARVSTDGDLLRILEKVLEDPRTHRSDAQAPQSLPLRFQQERVIRESNPSKVSRPVVSADHVRDCTAEEQPRQRAHWQARRWQRSAETFSREHDGSGPGYALI